MAQQKIADLRTMSADQIEKELGQLYRAQLNFRFQKVSGQMEKTHEVSNVRRRIAQLKTIQSERVTNAAATK
jgi:large subunit ribosomal protein L29